MEPSMRRFSRLLRAGLVVASAASFAGGGCSDDPKPLDATQTFQVKIVSVNGDDPPTASDPLPANTGDREETWEIEVEAVGPDGNVADFDGMVNLSVQPGAVVSVENLDTNEALGKNLQLSGGKAHALVTVTAVYGPARLWIQDLGYVKAAAGKTPACSNGQNDDPDEDVLIDFPADPGCAFADDDTEEGGTFAAGTSPGVQYELPSIEDIQGRGSTTPFPYESITVNTEKEHELIVTRYSKDGFYVTDLSGQADGFNSLFVFTFSTPSNLRPCDRVTFLTGTISEFFGFTELNFPSYDVSPIYEGQEDKCKIPEPPVLDADTIASPVEMEKVESALVRIQGFHIAKNFGPKLALNNVFAPDQSNCDFNGDGKVDFESEAEGTCGNQCSANEECSEWTGYISRGNYKVAKADMTGAGVPVTTVMQVQTDGAPGLNPVANRGGELTAVTGTLRNFSGGSLNWTVEARCPDDVVCGFDGCSSKVKGPKEACINLRTLDDNDEGSN